MNHFGENLRGRARALGLSDAEVARRTGLSERRYGHYVTGRRQPDFATLRQICLTLGVTPNDLLVNAMVGEHDERALLTDRLMATANLLDLDRLRMAIALVNTLYGSKPSGGAS